MPRSGCGGRLPEGGNEGERDTGPTGLAMSFRAVMRRQGKAPGDASLAAATCETRLKTDDLCLLDAIPTP